MKTLYIDAGMGAAGDMLTAALLELLLEPEAFLEELNGLGIPGVVVEKEKTVKCGITGTHISVKIHGVEEDGRLHEHHHHHSGMEEIQHIIGHLALPEKVRADVLAVYDLIAQAESHVHGVPVEQIHFHEVGTMDAIADVTAVCLLMHRLDPQKVVASPVHVGSGSVRCAHGILPVPAPATAWLLRDIPMYGGSIRGELCTPTGAALLRHFVTDFSDMPVMKVEKIGYGMGKKDFEQANCVRVLLGETRDTSDRILELSCNVDDMTGEAIGFALEELLAAGALEAFTTAAGMKKSRPGTVITVLCREEDKENMVRLLFRHTTTLGIRETLCRRYVLERQVSTVDTPLGRLRHKDSCGYGVTRRKYEYEDLAAIAREKDLSLSQVLEQLPKE